jgi:hypothetical protein
MGYDMFHDMYILCNSPDIDGMFHGRIQGTKNEQGTKNVHDMFTMCLFISPDLDGHRAPNIHGMFHNMEGHMEGYVSRYVCSLVRTYR